MAEDYVRLAGVAEVEAFDGTLVAAEALETAYPGVISVAGALYPTLTGTVTVDPAATGVVVDVELTPGQPYVVTFDVTNGATDTGDVTIEWFDEDPIVLEVTLGDNALTVAAALAGGTYPGFTAVDNLDGTITITQDASTYILDIVSDNGQILNAYKDDYIVWEDTITNFVETETIRVWGTTEFTKYFQAVGN